MYEGLDCTVYISTSLLMRDVMCGIFQHGRSEAGSVERTLQRSDVRVALDIGQASILCMKTRDKTVARIALRTLRGRIDGGKPLLCWVLTGGEEFFSKSGFR